MSFHMRIVECTGSVALSKAIEKTHVLTFNWLYDISAKLTLPGRWHGELMEALVGKDPEVAERAMRTHINFGLREIQETLAQQLGPGPSRAGRASGKSPKAASQGWRKKSVRRSSLASKKIAS
jgi:FCD domain